jgi:hypothetical protein
MKTQVYPVKSPNYKRFEVGYVNDTQIHVYAEGGFRGVANIELTSLQQVRDLYEALGNVLEASKSIEKYHLEKFYFDEMPSHIGYSSNNYWNGWAMPYFTKEVAFDVIDEIVADGFSKAWYVEADDTFYIHLHQGDSTIDPEMVEWAEGKDILVNGELVHVYQLGDGWTWNTDEIEE